MLITALLLFLQVVLLVRAPFRFANYIAAKTSCQGAQSIEYWLALLLCYYVFYSLWGLLLGVLHLFHFQWFFASGVLLLFLGQLLPRRTAMAPALETARECFAASPRLAASLLVLLLLLSAKLLFVRSINYDTIMYHLPVIATWMSAGSLDYFEQWFYIARYPFGWELVSSFWMFAPGTDALVLVPSLFAWVGLLLAVALFALEAGAAPRASVAASIVAATAPLVLASLHAIHVDVPLAAAFASVAAFALRYVRTRQPVYLLLLCFSAALLCSIKMSGPIYCIVAVLPAMLDVTAAAVRTRACPPALRALPQHWLTLVSGLIVLLFVGGFWYFRNWIEWGNPLGFVEIKLGSTVIFPVRGPVEAMVQDPKRGSLLTLFEPSNLEHWKVVLGQVAAHFLPQLALILVCVIAGAAALCWHVVYRNLKAALVWTTLLSLFFVTIYLYLGSPFTGDNGSQGWRLTSFMGWQLRYAFPVLVPGACACALVFSRLPQGLAAACAVLAATAGTLSLLFEPAPFLRFNWNQIIEGADLGALAWQRFSADLADELAVQFAGTVLILFAAIAGCAPVRSHATRRILVWTLLLLFCVPLVWIQAREARTRYGGITDWVAQQVGQEDLVAYAASHKAYYFWRSDRANVVRYLPAAPGETAEAYVARLRSAGAAYLGIGPRLGKAVPRETGLLEDAARQGLARLAYPGTRTEPVVYALE